MLHETTIHIEELQAMRVATITVNSESPEQQAVDTLINWARQRSLLDGDYRFFGYDSCKPYPDHTYTTWLTVDDQVNASGNIEFIEFPGGLYAVTETISVDEIGELWKQLEAWLNNSEYQYGGQVSLEEHLNPTAQEGHQFKLYLSIKK